MKRTCYFSAGTFCKNKASVRKAEIFKRAKNVQSIKIRPKNRETDVSAFGLKRLNKAQSI